MVAKAAKSKQQEKPQKKKKKQKQPPAKFSKTGVSFTASVLLILQVIYENLVALRLSTRRPTVRVGYEAIQLYRERRACQNVH